MHLEPVLVLKCIEVPDNNVSLCEKTNKSKFHLKEKINSNNWGHSPIESSSYLEALVRLLSTGDVLSRVGDDDDREFVVVASQELLCPADDVSDDDGGAQREDQVLIVLMQNQSLFHVACITNKELIKREVNGGGVL